MNTTETRDPIVEQPESVEQGPPLTKTKTTKPKKNTKQPLKLEIQDGSVSEVPSFGQNVEAGVAVENEEPVADFTVEDAKLLSASIWNIPGAILGPHLEPDQKLVDRFGEQLFGYCQRKEINLWDYAFEELPLMISGMALGGAMVKAQLQHMAEVKEQKKLEEAGEKEKKNVE